MGFNIDDIIFWMLIIAALAVILWVLHGSPTAESALVSIGIFFLSSELFLWRKYFDLDKKIAVNFIDIKSDIKEIRNNLNNLEKTDEKILKILRADKRHKEFLM